MTALSVPQSRSIAVSPASFGRLALASSLAAVATASVVWSLTPQGTVTDWADFFVPAARLFIAGGDPYSVPGFYNPPWALLPYLPALIQPQIGMLLFRLLAIASFLFVGLRLKARPGCMAMLLCSRPALDVLWDGTLDAFVLLAAVLPGAAILALVKPQVGLGLLLRARWSWLPALGLLGMSFLAYGFWPAVWSGQGASVYNVLPGFFPWGVPLALALALWFRTSPRALLLIGPLCAPYLALPSLVAVGMAASGSLALSLLYVLATWAWPLW